jgi:hypothetical protein
MSGNFGVLLAPSLQQLAQQLSSRLTPFAVRPVHLHASVARISESVFTLRADHN